MSISCLTGAMADVALAGLGDVHRQVADALEIGVDLHRRDDGAQVGGHRLMERQQPEAAVVNLDVQLIDRLVAEQHLVDERPDRACTRPVKGGAHALLGQPAHFEQPALERFELLAEVGDLAFH